VLPFLQSTATLPILVWTLSILPTYSVWHLRALGQPWVVPTWILALEYGSVAGTLVFLAVLGTGRSAEDQGPVAEAG
jgi:hypothetical protein